MEKDNDELLKEISELKQRLKTTENALELFMKATAEGEIIRLRYNNMIDEIWDMLKPMYPSHRYTDKVYYKIRNVINKFRESRYE